EMLYSVVTAYALLVGFAVWERRSRRGAEAKSFARGTFDRGSTALIATVFALGFILLPASLLLSARAIGQLQISPIVGWGGVALMALGIALRIWANQVLGRYFTRTLRVSPEQRVITDGPYRAVRHPGYLGDVVLWTGAALATGNWIVLASLTLAALLAYI